MTGIYKYPIPLEHAQQLLENFAAGEIIKTRYTLLYNGYVWEVDEFHGQLDGLIIAEIELENEQQPFSQPDWVTMEVTNDARYYNANLVRLHASPIEF